MVTLDFIEAFSEMCDYTSPTSILAFYEETLRMLRQKSDVASGRLPALTLVPFSICLSH